MSDQEVTPESKTQKINQLVPIFTVLIGVLGFMLPFIGFSYEQGYSSVFGVNTAILPRDPSELWTYSYYITLAGAIELLKIYGYFFLYILCVIIFIVFLVFVSLQLVGKKRARKFFTKIEKEKDKNTLLGDFLHLSELVYQDTNRIFLSIYCFGIALVLFVSLFAFPFNYGRDTAMENMSKFQEKGCDKSEWSNCIVIKEVSNPNVELFAGYLVVSSKKYLALYDGTKVEIVPRLENYMILRERNPKYAEETTSTEKNKSDT